MLRAPTSLLKAELLARLSKLHLAVFTPVFESFARPLTIRSAYEVHHAIREVVHGAGDLDRSFLLQIRQYWASPPNVFDCQFDICSGDGVDVSRDSCWTFHLRTSLRE